MAATYSPTMQCSTIGDVVSRCCLRPPRAPLLNGTAGQYSVGRSRLRG